MIDRLVGGDRPGLDRLRRRIRGTVLDGNDPRVPGVLAAFNPTVAHRPDVVVQASNAADVLIALDWARDHDVPWLVHGTGHAEIDSVRGGLVVTTAGLGSVTVDPATRIARVGAGARWRAVMDAADPHGLAPVCGSAPDVGVVGLLLGGGFGPLARSLGACSDRVRAVHLVLPGGGPLTVDADHRPDLFGALLGGRPDIGVVTGVDLALVAQEPLRAGGLYFAAADIPAVVDGYQRWLQGDVPSDLTTSLAVLRLPDLPTLPPVLAGRTVAHLRVAATGATVGDEEVPAALRRMARPVLGGVGPLPWARIGEIHNDPITPRVHVGGGLLLDAFTADTAHALVEVAGPQVPTPLTLVEIRHLGGALVDAPDDRADCVPGRDAAFGLWVSSHPFPLDPVGPGSPRAAASGAVRGVLDALSPWSPPAATINFTGSANTRHEVLAGWSPTARRHLKAVGAASGGRWRE
ncbi:FAD-binding oxidoreductase [Nakamurella leprariae]|uniref:FAD-binding oxidoreductase n=1 Tax=Nakamurella leprariae TaxID=2803911 RepID=A0A939C1S9_9ACTN|nr:FAD-binding protein [Nakamurella leprariae]MBM9467484.1 FAD-binding oxidoreductase [Nakamurella leprariae]